MAKIHSTIFGGCYGVAMRLPGCSGWLLGCFRWLLVTGWLQWGY